MSTSKSLIPKIVSFGGSQKSLKGLNKRETMTSLISEDFVDSVSEQGGQTAILISPLTTDNKRKDSNKSVHTKYNRLHQLEYISKKNKNEAYD